MTEWQYKELTKEGGYTKKEIHLISKEIKILAGKMKWALLSAKTSKAGKQINTKQISDTMLRDRMACVIKKVFDTYPEDYSFGDKGLQYDSVANTVNHIGAFVEIFRVLNLNKGVGRFPFSDEDVYCTQGLR
ncbi:hypothetical protein BX661DRAFT_217431 [Kickxella alabastrina]|uniref:uncharacterized protein n=1 Tax=Kickxella alabastrina TaxID=61397 RepID=UPI00221E9D6A|nr:uncharacterized protein BX661DRAFT_217431 [Kickxella alabastrina]KAI7833908.1 hypothetical protein BX661DRAFT_217431 [Kickxella alabastrina]